MRPNNPRAVAIGGCAIFALLSLSMAPPPPSDDSTPIESACWVIHAGEWRVLGANRTEACVTIEAGGTLETSAYVLTITGAGGLTCYGELLIDSGGVILSGGGNSRITLDGSGHGAKTVYLSESSSDLQITGSSHEISGSGTIVGWSSNAEIRIAAASSQIALTNNVNIEGMLKIRGMQPGAGQVQGAFVNGASGIVKANAAGVLEIKEGAIDDVDGALWRVESSASAFLRFSVAPASLDGDFMIAAGTLDIDASVSTAGGLCFTGGVLDVAPSVSFSASGAPASCP
jgi:hypothetical protein